ncbi:MAG: ACT domain-containing protein [Acidobacteria bacterium]|nr:ACT domain-containing protein [Acidobacteriota bacterium]
MRALLQLEVRNSEGALDRIFGVLRRRGYRIVRLAADRFEEDACFDCVMVLESERPVSALSGQLRKLFDVRSLHVSEQCDAAPAFASEMKRGESLEEGKAPIVAVRNPAEISAASPMS